MAFDHVVFPLVVARFSSVVSFDTTVTPMDTGFESRNVNWDDARIAFNAGSGVKTTADLTILIRFFRARKGAARGFLVKDWSDFSVTNQSIGTRTGTGVQLFQLVKTYTDYTVSDPVYGTTGNTDIREITKPKSGTVVIYANGVALVYGLDYTLNFMTGELTILAGRVTAGHLLTADFEFYVPVRFEQDTLRTDLILWKITNGLGEAPDVPLIEIRDFT